MSRFYISTDEKVMGYDDSSEFTKAVDVLLQFGKRFLVTVAKDASSVCKEINEIFKRHGVEVALHVDSDPDAMDYVANGLIGAAGGGLAGGVLGGAAYFIARQAAVAAVPGLGPCLLVGSIAGALIGAAVGVAVTRWGLTIRFSPWNAENIDIEFVPAT